MIYLLKFQFAYFKKISIWSVSYFHRIIHLLIVCFQLAMSLSLNVIFTLVVIQMISGRSNFYYFIILSTTKFATAPTIASCSCLDITYVFAKIIITFKYNWYNNILYRN